ncbi:MAG: glycoprotein endopeptidase [Mycoplasmataceae bacterium CE_OT135]|nr:MAG: glycoprotein endopeptidase [Mycoplasmataceae bacterium CE_OT135]
MLCLLFSLTSQFLFIALLENEKCLKSRQRVNFRQHSENFFPILKQVLAKTNHSLKEIEKVYFTSLPGSQTGHRISLTFALTLQVLNPQIKIYHLNSLLFQAGKSRAISLISIDQKKTKYHCAVYRATKCLVEPKKIDLNVSQKQELIQIKKQFSDYLIYEDFHQIPHQNLTPKKIRFLTNFRQLLPYFQLLESKKIRDFLTEQEENLNQ